MVITSHTEEGAGRCNIVITSHREEGAGRCSIVFTSLREDGAGRYVWHRMLFFNSHLPSTIARHVESDRPINIVNVRPSGRPSVVS